MLPPLLGATGPRMPAAGGHRRRRGMELLLLVALAPSSAAAAPNCMSYADDDCDGCTSHKDGRCPSNWCDEPCIYFSTDDVKTASDKDTSRCQPARFWDNPTVKSNNPGAECWGDKTECQTSCSNAPKPDAGWGLPLMLALTVAGLAYLAVGIAVGARRGGSSGVKAHVHYRLWSEIAGLARDGVAVATGRTKPGQASQGGGAAFAGSGASRPLSKKSKKEKAGKQRGKDRGLSEPLSSAAALSGGGGGGGSGPAVASAPAASASALAADGTAAGDGCVPFLPRRCPLNEPALICRL